MESIQNDISVKEARASISKLNRLLLFGIGLVELILLGLMVYVTFFQYPKKDDEIDIFSVMAMDLVLLWLGVVIGYYSWAVYHYNINFGLTNEDWARIRRQQELGLETEVVNENPHKDQTLGLPEGTVRGTLALTLAVGALSMLMASLGMEDRMPVNMLFIDVFEFFKTAFLMMIAFYFGNKSLQYLNDGSNTVKSADSNNPSQQIAPPPEPASTEGSTARHILNDDMADTENEPLPDDNDFNKSGAVG
ncbi:hypothetical protein LVD15_22185 [Fulvivirga maritima]|uniref:hypothetical protein n=1 Tax=Fulvivirga maritima TaxID=2904247 RepID=UPI001F2B99F2|nr:hypothetical protein [Fulvivirga maritima]UII25984.1 hypothetical protein LVD15_22185 [Fulvivirga maritima]